MNQGLSPRVRGNPKIVQVGITRVGPIPAGAGEPMRQWVAVDALWAYPRGCGGTKATRHHLHPRHGLSPRVRGNQSRPGKYTGRDRPIPAGAGEPGIGMIIKKICRAYPRGCGGTDSAIAGEQCHVGLSPRVRGNPRALFMSAGMTGPIPAGAGEPGGHRRGIPA